MRHLRIFPLLALLAALPARADTLQQARGLAADWLRQRFAQADGRVETTPLPLDPRRQPADCAVPLVAGLPGEARPAPRMSVVVRCPAPGGWELRVPVALKLYRPVLVANHTLARGDGVGAGDVHSELRDVTRLGYGWLESPEQLAGRSLARSLAAGAVLTPAALGGRQMVRAGDHIEVLAEEGGIAVRARGVALGSGDSGARLRVRNDSSGRIIDAEVRGPGLAVALP
ncbi:MAG: flagellar basal body P-ring formation chaperone FlgA [Fulvimonas sp.]|nr:flagellar basal body P-ring formation chaperone FlgA [Fulvimonas sp.]